MIQGSFLKHCGLSESLSLPGYTSGSWLEIRAHDFRRPSADIQGVKITEATMKFLLPLGCNAIVRAHNLCGFSACLVVQAYEVVSSTYLDA